MQIMIVGSCFNIFITFANVSITFANVSITFPNVSVTNRIVHVSIVGLYYH